MGVPAGDEDDSGLLMTAVQNAVASVLGIPVSAVRDPSAAASSVSPSSEVVQVQVLVNSDYDCAALGDILGGSRAQLTSDIVSNLEAYGYAGSLSGLQVWGFCDPAIVV